MIATKLNQRFIAFAICEDKTLSVYVVDGPDIDVVAEHIRNNLPHGMTLCEVWPDYDLFDLADSAENDDPDFTVNETSHD